MTSRLKGSGRTMSILICAVFLYFIVVFNIIRAHLSKSYVSMKVKKNFIFNKNPHVIVYLIVSMICHVLSYYQNNFLQKLQGHLSKTAHIHLNLLIKLEIERTKTKTYPFNLNLFGLINPIKKFKNPIYAISVEKSFLL